MVASRGLPNSSAVWWPAVAFPTAVLYDGQPWPSLQQCCMVGSRGLPYSSAVWWAAVAFPTAVLYGGQWQLHMQNLAIAAIFALLPQFSINDIIYFFTI